MRTNKEIISGFANQFAAQEFKNKHTQEGFAEGFIEGVNEQGWIARAFTATMLRTKIGRKMATQQIKEEPMLAIAKSFDD